MRKIIFILAPLMVVVPLLVFAQNTIVTGEKMHGTRKYEDFQKSGFCRQCHVQIYYQWQQSMMARAFTHHWDEIEYFNLAVEHGKRNPKFKAVADGCNGCHTPIAFMAGDTPPPRPEKKSMANEGVSCDVCHTIAGYDEAQLNNFSFYSEPGKVKYGPRGGGNSPVHELKKTELLASAKFCANCHNEKSPWGVFVKGTYNEWLAGPYAAEGVQCHVCHMPTAQGVRAITDTNVYPDMRLHLFHGAHVSSKTSGAIDVLIQPDQSEIEVGDSVVFSVQLYNQKCGHKVPSGSVEDRLLYLHVEAVDAAGKIYHLPVNPKKFEGEEYTIASDARAYRDLAEMMDVPEGFDGLLRDGVPIGDRIFRMPYFTENGEMTMAQWNTASFGVDYRIGPRETKIETYTWTPPGDIAPGKVSVRATLAYKLLVPSVGEFLKVPEEEYQDRIINVGVTSIDIF